MPLASTEKVICGLIGFAIYWILSVFPAFPLMPVGRTAGSLMGAMFMIVSRVIDHNEAYKSIDLPILGLLFGTMVVSAYLERADMFVYLQKLLSWRTRGPKDLICRICLISAVSSAIFTNDTTCVVLTGFILKIARQQNIPPHPYLLALASSANIGSAATPIGNPQNFIIKTNSKLSFLGFLRRIFPAMIVGLVVNAAILLCMYWKVLSIEKRDEEANLPVDAQVVTEEDALSHRFSPARMSHLTSEASQELNDVLNTNNVASQNTREINQSLEIMSVSNVIRSPRRLNSYETWDDLPENRWKRMLWKIGVYAVTIGMIVSLIVGLDMSWTAIGAALVLLALDFKDATPCLDKVSYSVLVFFCGMFMTIDGFNTTGIPAALWDKLKSYAVIDHASGITILSIIILIMSNIASNVPTVILLGSLVAKSAAELHPSREKKAWMILAWVSTVGGNLSIPGSAANIIVCEQARSAQPFGYNLTFWRHLVFGIPSTFIVTAIGSTVISLLD